MASQLKNGELTAHLWGKPTFICPPPRMANGASLSETILTPWATSSAFRGWKIQAGDKSERTSQNSFVSAV